MLPWLLFTLLPEFLRLLETFHGPAQLVLMLRRQTYLQLRMSWKSVIVPVMRPMMQFAFIQVAFVIALTRVRDHYHFYSDVAAGAILGILCAFITVSIT